MPLSPSAEWRSPASREASACASTEARRRRSRDTSTFGCSRSSIQPGLLWFRLGRAPEFWADIVATGTFALYHPFDPHSMNLALYAVESQSSR